MRGEEGVRGEESVRGRGRSEGERGVNSEASQWRLCLHPLWLFLCRGNPF